MDRKASVLLTIPQRPTSVVYRSTLVDPMHYPATGIQAAPSAIILSMIWYGAPNCLRRIYHPSKNYKAFKGPTTNAPMISLIFHGVISALPGMSQLLTLWPPLTWACHLLVQPQQLKRRPNVREICTLKSPAIIISFTWRSRYLDSVLLIRSVRTSSLLCMGHRISSINPYFNHQGASNPLNVFRLSSQTLFVEYFNDVYNTALFRPTQFGVNIMYIIQVYSTPHKRIEVAPRAHRSI